MKAAARTRGSSSAVYWPRRCRMLSAVTSSFVFSSHDPSSPINSRQRPRTKWLPFASNCKWTVKSTCQSFCQSILCESDYSHSHRHLQQNETWRVWRMTHTDRKGWSLTIQQWYAFSSRNPFSLIVILYKGINKYFFLNLRQEWLLMF